MVVQTVGDVLRRVDSNAALLPKYAEKVRELLLAHPDDEPISDTDVYWNAKRLVSWNTQAESNDDWSKITDIIVDPNDLAPDGEQLFLADPLGWLDYWDPITSALGRWEIWFAKSAHEDREALDEAVRTSGLGDSLDTYITDDVPDEPEAWVRHYQRLLDLTRTL